MKLHTTRRSPYARKVLVMAMEKGLKSQIEVVIEDLANKSEALLKANPLGQVPTLIMDNGKPLYDSAVIADYIDSLTKENRMIPKRGNKRFYVLRVTAIADGMVENAVGLYYETIKPEDQQNAAKMKKTTDNLMRCFKALEKEAKKLGKEVTMAPIAVGSAIGYINFRLPELGWQKKCKKLDAWFAEFSQRPSMKETEPRM